MNAHAMSNLNASLAQLFRHAQAQCKSEELLKFYAESLHPQIWAAQRQLNQHRGPWTAARLWETTFINLSFSATILLYLSPYPETSKDTLSHGKTW